VDLRPLDNHSARKEIPIDPKTFRNIAKSAVASPFSSRGKVEKVIVAIGTKRRQARRLCGTHEDQRPEVDIGHEHARKRNAILY